MIKRLAILLLALLAAARPQDTVAKPAAYKLEEHIPADFNIFVSIDSGQKFMETYEDSGPAKFIRTARREILRALRDNEGFAIGGAAVLGVLGTITKHLEKCQGQVAVAVRAQPWDPRATTDAVIAGDFVDETAAEAAAKAIPIPKGAEEPLVVRDGGRLWFYSTKAVKKEVEETGSEKSLATSDFFSEARKTATGALFLWVDVRKMWQLLPDDETVTKIVDPIGLRSIRGYAISLTIAKDAVDQTQALFLEPKATGALGRLAAVADVPLEIKEAPAGSRMVYVASPKFAAFQGDLMRIIYEATGMIDQPGMKEGLELLDVVARGEKPMGSSFLVEDGRIGGFAWVDKAEDYLRSMRETYERAGVKYTKETRDGLDIYVGEGHDNPIAEMMMNFGSAIAAKDGRYYFGLDADAVARTYKLVAEGKAGSFADEPTFKALRGERPLAGWGFFYVDARSLTTFIEKVAPAMKNVQPIPEETWTSITEILKDAGAGYDVIASKNGNIVVESRSTSGVTIGSAAWAMIAAAVAIPAVARTRVEMNTGRCVAEMKRLNGGLAKWSTDVAETPGDFPTERGHTLWARLKADGVLDGASACPLTGQPYRGPVDDANKLGDKDVLALCDHGMEGVVLLRDGTVDEIDFGSLEHSKAWVSTCMTPPLDRTARTWTFKGPGDAAMTLAVGEFAVRDGVETVEYEMKGGDGPDLREVLVVTDTGLRILRREVGGKAVTPSATEDVNEKTFEALRDKRPVQKSRALQTLAQNYYAAREQIDRELSKDNSLKPYLSWVRNVAANQFAPVKIPYPLEKGKAWTNAYGEKGEVLEAGSVKTPEGTLRAWKIRLEADGKTRDLWWSDQLHVPLEVGDYKIQK